MTRRRTWFYVRVAIYLAVVAALLLSRGEVSWRRLFSGLKTDAPATLTIGGRSLAPQLIDRLVLQYRQDYPQLEIRIAAGGTNQALEAVANGLADVAFLSRPPTAAEQRTLLQVRNDTLLVEPVAVGAIEVLAGAACDTAPVSLEQLRDAVLAGSRPVYVPEPNEGLWDALRASLDLAAADPPPGSPVVFVADEAAVVAAVAADPQGWGLVSSLAVTDDGPRRLRVGPEAALPGYEAVATGSYPLFHRLSVACLSGGGIEAGKFVTHLASGRGARQVERAGVVPAAQVMREIVLTREPLGQ